MSNSNEAMLLSGPQSEVGKQEEFSMIALITLFWSRRRFFFWSMMAGLILSVVYAYVTPSRYESTASLMPPDPFVFSGNDTLGLAAGMGTASGQSAAAMTGRLLGENTMGDLFLAILQSHTVQDDIINRFDLKHIYHAKTNDEARKTLTRNTNAKEEAKSKVISITVTDTDPRRAQAIANAYIDELDHLASRLTTSKAHRERVFLETRLQTLKVELDSASQELGKFSSRSGTLDIENQGRAMIEATAHIQGELIVAKSDLSALQSAYAPENARVRAAQAKVDELENQLRRIGGVGQQDTASAQPMDSQVYPSLRELPLMGSKYLDLSRDVKVLEAVYEILTRDYELAKVQEAKEIPSVKVLDAPDLAENRSFPRRKLIVALWLSIFFAFSALWVYVEASWKATNNDDPRKKLLSEMAMSLRHVFWKRKQFATTA